MVKYVRFLLIPFDLTRSQKPWSNQFSFEFQLMLKAIHYIDTKLPLQNGSILIGAVEQWFVVSFIYSIYHTIFFICINLHTKK